MVKVTKADIIKAREAFNEALRYSEENINPWTVERLRNTYLLKQELEKLRRIRDAKTNRRRIKRPTEEVSAQADSDRFNSKSRRAQTARKISKKV